MDGITSEEAHSRNLFFVASIPGKSFDHALWRLTVHFRDKLDEIVAYTMEKGNSLEEGEEGAVRVGFWAKEQVIKV